MSIMATKVHGAADERPAGSAHAGVATSLARLSLSLLLQSTPWVRLGGRSGGRGGSGIDELPADGEAASVHVAVVESGEEGGAHVEVALLAAGAAVDDLGDLLDASLGVGDLDKLATGSTAVGGAAVRLVLGVVDGNDELRVRVGVTAGAEADGVVGGIAGEVGRGGVLTSVHARRAGEGGGGGERSNGKLGEHFESNEWLWLASTREGKIKG